MEKNSYYIINRYLLQICGVWPYENTRLQYVRAAFILGTFSVYVLHQLVPLFHKHSFELIVKTGSITLPFVVCSLQFVMFVFSRRNVKYLLDYIFEEWQVLKDWKELKILRKYAKFNKKLTTLLLFLALLFWLLLLLAHLAPIVVNRPGNVSGTKRNNASADELNADKIFYIFVLFVGNIVMMATSTTILGYMRHICAMLKITCYRIEHSLDVSRRVSTPQKERVMLRKLVSAVDVHRRTTMSTKFTLSNLRHFYFLMVILSVASFAVSLLQAIQVAESFDNVSNFVNSSFFVLIHIIYFFVLNYGGQLIQDHDVNVLKTLYSIQWYVAPIRVQKLILFLMLRYTRSFRMIIGGIYVVSLEGFVTLVSTSVSYFMVLHSTQ